MSKTEVFNQALSAAGSRGKISDPDEDSLEAETCRLWYDTARKAVLSAAPWASARRYARLALLSSRTDSTEWAEGDPDPQWTFVYSAPADMLRPRRLSTGARFDMSLRTDNTVAIQTNQENAVLYYFIDQENTTRWEPNLKLAVVYTLAAHVAMPLHAKTQRTDWLQRKAMDLVLEARAADANAVQTQMETIPDWLQVRGTAHGQPIHRYAYPFNTLFSEVPQTATGDISNIPGATGSA